MSRFLLASSAMAAALLSSGPAIAETSDDESQRDPSSDIVVTARIEDRDLQDLKTPALGVGIGGEQITAINAANAEDVLRYSPAIMLNKRYVGDADAAISLRTMHTFQTPRALITVDGFPISNFLGATFLTGPKWGVLAPGDITRAEIVYGPTSARYSGHSTGGTVLLKTRDITETGARLSAQLYGQTFKYYQTDEDLFGWSVDAGFEFALGDRGGISLSYRRFENEAQPMQWRTEPPRVCRRLQLLIKWFRYEQGNG